MTGEMPIARLRQYLGELRPRARAMLAAELERALLRGEEVLGASFILEELRRDLRQPGRPVVARAGYPQRLFFAPLGPFLVNDALERKHLGRVARACLDPIWQWLCRDLMPAEAKSYSEQINLLLAANERDAAEQVARAFQDIVVERMRETLAEAKGDDKAQGRLSGQVGTPRAGEYLLEIDAIFRARDALAVVASRLPDHISNLADEQLDNVKALLDSPVGRHRDVFLYALLVVMGRLGAPWQLIRLAVRAANSDATARVAQTPFAVAVDIVIGEIERAIADLRVALATGRGDAVTALIKDIHDAARALHTEMDLAGDTPWARRLAAARVEVAKLLQVEIESVPGRVRRLLRPRTGWEASRALDSADVADTEAALDLFGTCRTYASELALSEATRRVHSELQNFFDTGTQMLLDGLRAVGPGERACRESQVDAAVRFCSKLFGPEYAALLTKAADVAAKGELKSARA